MQANAMLITLSRPPLPTSLPALAEYRFARDNAETKFLDWRVLPEDIAVLPELTFTRRDGLCRMSMNDSNWRMAA